jgi:hypothetical protein
MDPPPALTTRDHARAVLVLLHVIAVLGMSLPSPEGFRSGTALRTARVARQVAAWENAVATVGVPVDVTHAVILRGGGALERAEDAFEEICGPYARLAGTEQSWRMFSSSPSRADRFEVWIEDGAWRPLYRPFDPDARWRAALWEDGRVRGMIHSLGNTKFADAWKGFAESVARRARADFPTATRLRVERVPVRIPPPEELVTTGQLAADAPASIEIPMEAP